MRSLKIFYAITMAYMIGFCGIANVHAVEGDAPTDKIVQYYKPEILDCLRVADIAAQVQEARSFSGHSYNEFKATIKGFVMTKKMDVEFGQFVTDVAEIVYKRFPITTDPKDVREVFREACFADPKYKAEKEVVPHVSK